jgi:hypothetical protein
MSRIVLHSGFGLPDKVMSGYFWQTFQPSAILLSAVFRFFGGGYSVMNAVVLAAVTDAVPEAKRLVLDDYHIYASDIDMDRV